jgi:nucleophosmin 3
MKGGLDAQKYVDLLVPSAPATFRLVRGAGPIHLVGSHCVTNYGEAEEDEENQDESEASETDAK